MAKPLRIRCQTSIWLVTAFSACSEAAEEGVTAGAEEARIAGVLHAAGTAVSLAAMTGMSGAVFAAASGAAVVVTVLPADRLVSCLSDTVLEVAVADEGSGRFKYAIILAGIGLTDASAAGAAPSAACFPGREVQPATASRLTRSIECATENEKCRKANARFNIEDNL